MPTFQEQGIQFKVISPDMHEDVMDFLWAHFFPDEPLFRSIGLSSERLSFIDKDIFGAVFQQNCSVAAVDSDGKILAVRVGIIKNRDCWRTKFENWMFHAFPYRLLSRFIPPSLHNIPTMIKMMKTLKFDVWKMFDVWDCPSIYEGLAVCSARTHGIRGLGSEVVRRCEELAKEKGCAYTYLMATGNFSRKLFSGLGYTHLDTLTYSEFRDERGELYLKDTREHIAATTWCKQL